MDNSMRNSTGELKVRIAVVDDDLIYHGSLEHGIFFPYVPLQVYGKPERKMSLFDVMKLDRAPRPYAIFPYRLLFGPLPINEIPKIFD